MTLDQYRKLSHQLIELQWYCQKSVLVPNTPEKPTSNNEQDSCTLVVPQSPESLIFTNITACFSNPKMKCPTFTKCYAFSFRPCRQLCSDQNPLLENSCNSSATSSSTWKINFSTFTDRRTGTTTFVKAGIEELIIVPWKKQMVEDGSLQRIYGQTYETAKDSLRNSEDNSRKDTSRTSSSSAKSQKHVDQAAYRTE